ncbi:DNA repair protein RecO [Undibacterium sp. BYS50W]|nr:DNA repair protein RecO [Undibacterium rugosum]MBR7778075.1 DNA repair protein RecO [Undibacterium rugosum]
MSPATDAVAEDLADYLQDPLRVSAPVKKRSTAASSATRERKILQQPGFVLHARPYKETSLIVDVLTRDFGRIALVAKGAKRPHSQLRSVLQTFQPLNLSWMGKAELKTLTSADWVGGMLPLEKSALVCGFYLNELIIKFLLKDEPHPALFDQYVATINQLAHGESAPVVLRQFELVLLRQSGLLGDIHLCTEQRAVVQPELHYVLDPQAGTRPARPGDHFPVLNGACLLAMADGDYSLPETQFQSKMLMRFLLSHHLHGAVLSTRQLLIDLQNL